MEGIITNIQRLSTEDGPGIRTTIFLKGCALSCKWCHNPESLSSKPEIGVVTSRCNGCGECIPHCPEESLSLQEGRIAIDDSRCTCCFECVPECYRNVFAPVGIPRTPESITEEVMRDRLYFETSGGGVTLSGGEPLLQKEFTTALLHRFAALKVDTIVETALYCKLDRSLTEALKTCSAVYADIKLWDPEEHKRWTGCSNSLILKNIRALDDAGIPLLIRTPVIPKVNDSYSQLKEIADFVKTLSCARGYHLIPYHPYGLVKYDEFRKEKQYIHQKEYRTGEFRNLESQIAQYFGDRYER